MDAEEMADELWRVRRESEDRLCDLAWDFGVLRRQVSVLEGKIKELQAALVEIKGRAE